MGTNHVAEPQQHDDDNNDEVEIEDNDQEELNNNDVINFNNEDDALRPVTSRGSRPGTARNVNDQFLVETTIVDNDQMNMHDQLILGAHDNQGHGRLVADMLKVRADGLADEERDDLDNNQEDYKFTPEELKVAEKKRQELVKIQDSISNLTTSIKALGKVVDYADEDAAQMNKENKNWRQQVLAAKKNLKPIYTNSVVNEKLNRKIMEVKEIEAEVEHRKAQIRSQIYTNMQLEDKLDKLTTNLVR